MTTQPTSYQLSLSGANWIDVNTGVSINNLPDRLPDDICIVHCSLYNLFNCSIGERGKIWQPEYGSQWREFLQEPIDEITAAKMRIAMIQAVARWEPRINLNTALSTITPDYNIPGYQVRIVGTTLLTKQVLDIRFSEQAG